MMANLATLFLVLALILFIIAAFRVQFAKVDLLAAALALLTAYWLFRLFSPPVT